MLPHFLLPLLGSLENMFIIPVALKPHWKPQRASMTFPQKRDLLIQMFGEMMRNAHFRVKHHTLLSGIKPNIRDLSHESLLVVRSGKVVKVCPNTLRV